MILRAKAYYNDNDPQVWERGRPAGRSRVREGLFGGAAMSTEDEVLALVAARHYDRQQEAEEVVSKVAAAYRIDPAIIWSKQRKATVSEARAMAFWLLYQRPSGWTFTEIGRMWGMHHSAVLRAVRRGGKVAKEVLG